MSTCARELRFPAMIIISGTITVDPGKRDEILDAAKAVMEGTRAEAGNQAYVLVADPLDDDTIRVFEQWDGEDALSSHMAAPHMQEFTAALGQIGGITGMDMTKHQVASSGPLFG